MRVGRKKVRCDRYESQAHAYLRFCFLEQAVYDNNIAEDDHLYEDVSFMTRTRCTCEVYEGFHSRPASDPAFHN